MSEQEKTPTLPEGANPRLVPCKDIQAVLFDYMSHELGDKQSWFVHEHLLHCEECRREAAEIKTTLDLLRSDTSIVVPEHLPNTMRRRLERAILHPFLDWIYEHRRIVAWVVAVGVIAVLVLLACLHTKPRPGERSFWFNFYTIRGGAAETSP